ncbi:diguanylate cyclase [Myxococcota bacterium]|nr:diguanylate cyclase [Myxococcota bacterium]MBU1380254.1 diguanylate cyclase [Myxococcota bacterium]MBU1496368.1 diguanylate cyclase [Myxococcota bacterium]
MTEKDQGSKRKREPRPTKFILPLGAETHPPEINAAEGNTENTRVTMVNQAIPKIEKGVKNSFLVVLYPPNAILGRKVDISPDKPLIIGRHPDCDLHLNDDSVSRRHAKVETRPEGVYISDMGSTNNTYVGDSIIRQRKLESGSIIRIGQVLLKFLSGDDAEAYYHDDLYRLTIIDALTEAYNKRYLMDFLEREIERNKRATRSSLSIVMIDIDHFKPLNDNFGHLVGDLVLREVALRIKSDVRKGEIFARYGGEEFTVLCPETELTGAAELAERIRLKVCSSPIKAEGNDIIVTISLGVATAESGKDYTPEQLLAKADEKLYEAKNSGRNRTAF